MSSNPNNLDDNDKKSKLSSGKRKYHQKSRLGCSTCKKRRVKCDEARPICNKCQHMDLVCGYTLNESPDTIKQEIEDKPFKKRKTHKQTVSHKSPDSSDSSNQESTTQQATPSITPPFPTLDENINETLISDNASTLTSTLNLDSKNNNTQINKNKADVSNENNNNDHNNDNNESNTHNTNNTNNDINDHQNNNSTNNHDKYNESNNDNQNNNNNNSIPNPLLNAGNLNNLNLSHLVNNLSGLGDLSGLGNLASLSNLATLAQLPIDLSNLGSLIDSQIHNGVMNNQTNNSNLSGTIQDQLQSHLSNSKMNNSNSNPLMNLNNIFNKPNAINQLNGNINVNKNNGMKSMDGGNDNSNDNDNNDMDNNSNGNDNNTNNNNANVNYDDNNNSTTQQSQSYQSNPQDAKNQETNQSRTDSLPNILPNINTNASPNLQNNQSIPGIDPGLGSSLNMLDLRLMFHYTSQVSNTITGAGISDTNIWNHDIPMLAFNYPFLMHSILAFSATHLSRTEKGLDQCVTCHRGDALRLLREAVLDINSDNTDALVASALILIMDSLANASFPSSTSPKSLPASAWIFHVKGAATILTAVWPLTEASRFYKFISVDLGDLGDITNQRTKLDNQRKQGNGQDTKFFTELECYDQDIADLYPVEIESPYLITLAYLNKLHKERYKSDFILRIFAFPALLDKSFLSLLMTGDIKAMRIMRSYYKLLRSFTTEMKDKVWFLEGVSQVLPVDVEEYAGGAGGMHMMLDFLGGGPSIVDDHEIDEEIGKFDPAGILTGKLIDTNNLPSDITSNLDVMQGEFMNEYGNNKESID